MTQLEKNDHSVNRYGINGINAAAGKDGENSALRICSPSSSSVTATVSTGPASATTYPAMNGHVGEEIEVELDDEEGKGYYCRKKARLEDQNRVCSSSNTVIPLHAAQNSNLIGAFGGNQSYCERKEEDFRGKIGASISSNSLFGGGFGKIPGVVGFENLGNTCFMNSGLQALINTPPLVEFFLKSPRINPSNSGLTTAFQTLVMSAWYGFAGVHHPKDFKEMLGNNYSQFKDCRQHDCQEFLALTLDVLHEELKLWNNAKRDNTNSSGFASGGGASGAGEVESIVNDSDVSSSLQSPEESNGEEQPSSAHDGSSSSKKRRLTSDDSEVTMVAGKSSSPSKEDSSSESENCPPLEDVELEGDMEEGERALNRKTKQAEGFWMSYIRDNNTVIASSFQGMYKSTVTCSACSFVSCTYEPFMYLSLPIPRTMEREFDIVFCCTGAFQTRNITVKVNVNDTVGQLKEMALSKIYSEKEQDIPSLSNFVVAEVVNYHVHNILKDDSPLKTVKDGIHNVYIIELNQNTWAEMDVTICNDFEIFHNPVGCLRPSTYLDEDWETETSATPSTSTSLGGGFIPASEGFDASEEYITADLEVPTEAEQSYALEDSISCCVCLDELPKSKLKQHYGCSCILCDECIKKTAENGYERIETTTSESSTLKCPVCAETIDYKKCFIPLVGGQDGPKRMHLIPVIFLNKDSNNNEPVVQKFIGHPIVVQIPASLPAKEFYEFVHDIVPFPMSTYQVKNASWSGKECGVCLYGRSCSGCEFRKEGIISINSRNSILISFSDLPTDLIDSIEPTKMAVCNNSFSFSYNNNCFKEQPIIDIYECFDTFSQIEVLDEQNPWFCPDCKKHQCATKSLTICRFPDYLIVYLKRFVFVDNSSNKLNNKLKFPIDGLDVSNYIAEEFAGGEHIYDLYSCVCHFGSAGGGHYTSYSKNPKAEIWHYFNDDSVISKAPSQDEFSSAYVLFYAKKGLKSDIPLKNFHGQAAYSINDSDKAIVGECDTTTATIDPSSPIGQSNADQPSNQEDVISSTSVELEANVPGFSYNLNSTSRNSVPSPSSSDKINSVGETVSNMYIDPLNRRRKRLAGSSSFTPTSTNQLDSSFEFNNESDESPTIKPYSEFAIENKRLTKVAQRSKYLPNTQAPGTSGGFRKQL